MIQCVLFFCLNCSWLLQTPTTELGLIIQAFSLSLTWWMLNASYSFYCKFLDTIAFEHSIMGGSYFAFSELLVIAFEHFPLGFISFLCQMACCLFVLSTHNLSLFYMLKIPSPTLSFAFNFAYGMFNHIEGSDCDVIQFFPATPLSARHSVSCWILNSSHNHKYIILFFPLRSLTYSFSDCTVYIILSEP